MSWIHFLWEYISYRKDLLTVLFICAILMSFAELSIPWLIKEAIDAILADETMIDLNRWLILTLGILGILYLLHAILLRFEAHMILHCSYNLRRRLIKHIHSQALSFFQRHRTGELMFRLTGDTKVFENEAARLFRDVPGEIVTTIGVVILMLFLHIQLALLILFFMILAAAVTAWLGQPLPTLRKSAQRIAARLSSRFQESIAGVRTVQAFRNEDYELSRLDRENRGIRDVEINEGKVYALMEPLGDLIELLGLVLVVWFGGLLIMNDEITAGALVAFIAYMEILARPLGRAEIYYRAVQSLRAVSDRLQDLLSDYEQLPVNGGSYQSNDAPSVELQNVCFRYRESEREILRDISFSVNPGEAVAVAGHNGAGKSSLMDLILRFYDPVSGRILIGSVDLREWNLEDWRDSTGLLTQDVFLFHGSILENISYGRPGADRKEVMEAVRNSSLDRLIDRFPRGLDTIVGERGTQLSGGERQSIALARLFLRKPGLLILDEPTSQLDGEALQIVGKAIRKLMNGRTTFLVTHHEETIRLADRVLFLKEGRLVAEGSHDELFTANKSYRSLWQKYDTKKRTVNIKIQ